MIFASPGKYENILKYFDIHWGVNIPKDIFIIGKITLEYFYPLDIFPPGKNVMLGWDKY